jgi:hypothetical protein
MLRFICVLILLLLISSPSLGQQSLVGTYKLVSHQLTLEGTLIEPLGKAPRGHLVLTPTHYITFVTGDNRKPGSAVADKAALLDTLSGWSGTYRVEGSDIIIAVEASWTEVWTGKKQVRHWALSGNRLTITEDPQPYPRDTSKTVSARQVWEKIE